MLRRALALSLICAAAAAIPGVALPATTCTITADTATAFGTYDVYAVADLTSSGTISYTCRGFGKNDTAQIGISTGASGSYTPRRMYAGTNALDYNLYQDAACSIIWGDGTGGSSLMTFTVRETFSIPVYGRIPAQQDAAVGAYADSVTVTIYF